MDFALSLPPTGPRGRALVAALRDAITAGRLRPGERLPASRTLAAQLNVSRGTVVSAYEELTAEGYCAGQVGAGTLVTFAPVVRAGLPAASHARLSTWAARLETSATTGEEAAAPFDFRPGTAAETFPEAALGRALRHASARLAMQNGSGHPAGSHRLRVALAAYLARARAVRANPSQVIVVSGTQQGLDLATRLLLNPGDAVCIEEPGYVRARSVLLALGARLLPAPVDGHGIDPATLPRARAYYVTPSHQHPTGAVLSPERRLRLLEHVAAADAWLLEDDYDSEFRFSGPPLPCMQGLDRHGRCLYLGSLSKLLHPALRAGYLVVPPALVPAAVAAKSALDQATTTVVQEALADLFESGEIERHLRRASRAYRARGLRLQAALERHLPRGVRIWPLTGGLHIFVELPDVDASLLRRELLRRGVEAVDGSSSYLQPPGYASLILWFGRIALDAIAPGVAALGEAVRAARAAAVGQSSS